MYVNPLNSNTTLSGGSTSSYLHFTDDKTWAQRCLSKLSKVTCQQVAGSPLDQVNIPGVHRLNQCLTASQSEVLFVAVLQ